MNKDNKMIDKLIEIDKQMKTIKVDNQTIVVDTENKDIEWHEITPDGEDTWHIVDGDGKVINTITKNDIINYCKRELEDNRTECLSPDLMIDSVWWYIEDDYKLEVVDNYCQHWDKFTAWFDYVVVEYFTQEIIALYKQRLRDFE